MVFPAVEDQKEMTDFADLLVKKVTRVTWGLTERRAIKDRLERGALLGHKELQAWKDQKDQK